MPPLDPPFLELIAVLRCRAHDRAAPPAAPRLGRDDLLALRAGLAAAVAGPDAFDALFGLYLLDPSEEVDESDPPEDLVRRTLAGGPGLAGLTDDEVVRLAATPTWVAGLRDRYAGTPAAGPEPRTWLHRGLNVVRRHPAALAASVAATVGLAAVGLAVALSGGRESNDACVFRGDQFAQLRQPDPSAPPMTGNAAPGPREAASRDGRLVVTADDDDLERGLSLDAEAPPGGVPSRLVEYRFEGEDGAARSRGYLLLRRGPETGRWSAQLVLPPAQARADVAAMGPRGRLVVRFVRPESLGRGDRAALAASAERDPDRAEWDDFLRAVPTDARPLLKTGGPK